MPMFELLDREETPTRYQSENPKELAEIANSLWPERGADKDWSIQIVGMLNGLSVRSVRF